MIVAMVKETERGYLKLFLIGKTKLGLRLIFFIKEIKGCPAFVGLFCFAFVSGDALGQGILDLGRREIVLSKSTYEVRVCGDGFGSVCFPQVP